MPTSLRSGLLASAPFISPRPSLPSVNLTTVTAVIIEDDGIKHIAFSRQSAEVMLAIMQEYAEDNPARVAQIHEAQTALRSVNLPLKNTTADTHYCGAVGIADGLRAIEEQLTKPGNDAALRELTPGFALCCFVKGGGRYGLRLAFSRDAAMAIYDQASGMPPHEIEAYKDMIQHMALPFPQARVPLDSEIEDRLATR